MKYDEVVQVEYRYTDSSVPPRYHRSYAITVTGDSAEVVVDSYGRVLAEKICPVSREQFEGVLQAFHDAGLSAGEETGSDGCTGGTTETVTLAGEEGVLFRGWVYHCAGEEHGTLRGDVESFAVAVRALIPDLAELRR